LTAETVIVALEDIEDYQAFEGAIIADYDARTAVERELVLRLASLLWRMRRATAIETDLLQIQAEILSDRRYDHKAGDDTGQRPQCVAYRVLQRAIAPSQHRRSGNGSSHADQGESIDDECDPLGAPRDDSYQSAECVTLQGFPNHSQNDSTWQTEGFAMGQAIAVRMEDWYQLAYRGN
jgi:hypothetical protein